MYNNYTCVLLILTFSWLNDVNKHLNSYHLEFYVAFPLLFHPFVIITKLYIYIYINKWLLDIYLYL